MVEFVNFLSKISLTWFLSEMLATPHIEPNSINKDKILLACPISEVETNFIEEIEESINNELYNKLLAIGLSVNQAKDILKNKDEKTILNHLNYLKDRTNIENPGGYAWKIFQEREIPEIDIKRDQRIKDEFEQKKEEKLKLDYEDYISKQIKKHRESLTEVELDELNKKATILAMEKNKEVLSKNTKTLAGSLMKTFIRLEENRVIETDLNLPSYEKWFESKTVL